MPTKEELAAQAKVDQLKALAAENEVDLGDATTKDDIVATITASNRVTKDQIDAVVNAPDGSGGPNEPAPGQQGPTPEPGEAGAPAGPSAPGTAIVPAGSAAASATALPSPEDAAARVEGRTSDASNRLADVRAADVPPDLSEGPKPSDAGPDNYPFPPQGDVDVASIPSTPKKTAKAERIEPLDGGDVWVRLGDHDDVPDELKGHIAVVLEAPTIISPDGVRVADTKKPIVVRTRDEHDARLQIPLEAVDAISRNGSLGVGARA